MMIAGYQTSTGGQWSVGRCESQTQDSSSFCRHPSFIVMDQKPDVLPAVADPHLAQFAQQELGETAEVRKRGLEEMRSWLVDQDHLAGCCQPDNQFRLDVSSQMSDNFLLRFLRCQKFNVSKAVKMMEKFLVMRVEHPLWFAQLDPTNNAALLELVDLGYVFVLPKRDLEGRRVIFNNAHVLDPARHTSTDMMKIFMATFEALLVHEENQIRGFTYVFYCKKLTLGHCGIWSAGDAATMFTSCEKNLPIRHRSINMMHLPFALWAVLEFAKSFLSSKIKSRIAIMNDDANLSKRLGVPDILPLEFGGQVPLKQMTSAWRAELLAHSHHLRALDQLNNLSVPGTSSSQLDSGQKKSFWTSWISC